MIKPILLNVGLACSLLAACGDDSKGNAPAGNAGSSGSASLPPCADVCTKVIATQCPSGPPTQADCVSGCETIRAGKCKDQYTALFECAGTNPSYTCNAGGYVQVVGCENADAALNTCLAGP